MIQFRRGSENPDTFRCVSYHTERVSFPLHPIGVLIGLPADSDTNGVDDSREHHMTNTKLPADDVQLLSGVAELFLWQGWDRAADFIYAALEAEDITSCDCTTGKWRDVFAG